MEIIEKIKTNKSIDNQTEIQKICLHKLQSSPLPNPKDELWRLSNKSKFSNFLDYPINEEDPNLDTPYPNNSKNSIRLVIGENCQIKRIEKNYSIHQLSEDELVQYIKEQVSFFDQNERKLHGMARLPHAIHMAKLFKFDHPSDIVGNTPQQISSIFDPKMSIF